MNPFEKLRRAVDKQTIEYHHPEQPQPTSHLPTGQLYSRVLEPKKNKFQQSSTQSQPINNQNNINNMLLDQQTQYIQQINQLSRKNQKLAKSLVLIQTEKQQFIQQICVLEKNNQLLEQKLKQIVLNDSDSTDKQRKYKQEIYRINTTNEMLGQQLNTERKSKKHVNHQFNKYKEQVQQYSLKLKDKVKQLEEKITSLEAQIQERTSMLEYNIKKNSEERKQNKLNIQRIKNQYDYKIQQLNTIIINMRNQLNSYKSNCDILNHKLSISSEKSNNYQIRQNAVQNQLSNQLQRNRQLIEQLKESVEKIDRLSLENQCMAKLLKQEKQNVKVKVVEIRDQTLSMQLQMYKKQCKQLLQQKAIWNKLSNQRTYQPSYQIVSNRF